MPVTGAFTEKYVSTHRILAILLDDIEMLRDHFFKKKLAEKQKVSDGFRSVVGTAEWQKLKETGRCRLQSDSGYLTHQQSRHMEKS